MLLLVLAALAHDPFFTLLRGRETARQPPLRELPLGFLAWDEWGSRMLVAGPEGVALHDPSGQRIRPLPCGAVGPENVAREAAFSPDGARAAVLTSSGALCAWNLEGAVPLLVDGGRGWAHIDLAADAVAVGHSDGTVELRDLGTGARRWRRNLGQGGVEAVRLSADGNRLGVAFGRRGAAVLDPRSGRLIRAFGQAPVHAIDFHPELPELVVGLDGGEVERWDTTLWRPVGRFSVGDAAVIDLDYRRAGDMLAIGTAASDESAVVVWSFEEAGEVLRESPRAPGTRLTRVRFNAQGDELVATDGRSWAALWRRPTRTPMPVKTTSLEPPLHRELRSEAPPPDERPAEPVALGPVDLVLPRGGGALVRREGGPRGVRRADGAEGATLAESTGLVAPLALSAEGDQVAGWSTDGWMRVWDLATGAVRVKLAADRPRALAWRGGRLLMVDAQGRVRLGAGTRWTTVSAAPADATAVAFDGSAARRVVVGTADGGVAVFPLTQAAPARVAHLHAGPVVAVAISDDGQRVASVSSRPGGAGAQVALQWVGERGGEEVPIARVETVPHTVQFAPGRLDLLLVADRGVQVVDGRDGSLHLDRFGPVAAAAWDGAVVRVADPEGRLWEAKPSATPLVPHLYGAVLARTPRGRRVATLDGDVLSVWDGIPGRLRRVGRPIGQAVVEAAFNPGGTHLALRYADRRVEVLAWEADTAVALPAPSAGASDWVGFTPDGSRVWSFEGPRELVARDVATGAVMERRVLPGTGRLEVEIPPGPGRIARVLGPDGLAGWLDLASPSPFGFAPAEGPRPLAVRGDGKVVAWLDPGGAAVRRRAASTGLADSPPVPAVEGRAIVAAEWTEDGALFVVLDAGGFVRVLDDFGLLGRLDVGGPARFGGEYGPPVALAPGPEGLLYTWDAEGRRRVFRQASGTELPREAEGALAVLPVGPLGPWAATADGSTLLLGGPDGLVRVLSTRDGHQRGLLVEPGGAVTAVAVSPDGRRAASAGADAAVWGYALADYTGVLPAPTFGDVARWVAVSPDGERVAALGPAGVLRTWEFASRRPGPRWRLLDGVGEAAKDLEFIDTSHLCVTVEDVRCIDVVDGTPLPPAPAPPPPDEAPVALRPWLGLRAEAQGPGFSPAPGLWVVPARDGRVVAWDLATRTVRWVYTGYSDGSWVVDRGDGVRVASRSLWDGSAPRVSASDPPE